MSTDGSAMSFVITSAAGQLADLTGGAAVTAMQDLTGRPPQTVVDVLTAALPEAGRPEQ